MSQRVLMLVEDAYKDNANDIARVIDPYGGGANTFSVALSQTGFPPVTHWGASMEMEDELYIILTTYTAVELKAWLDQLALDRGIDPVVEVTAYPDHFKILVGDIWVNLANENLQMVQEPI